MCCSRVIIFGILLLNDITLSHTISAEKARDTVTMPPQKLSFPYQPRSISGACKPKRGSSRSNVDLRDSTFIGHFISESQTAPELRHHIFIHVVLSAFNIDDYQYAVFVMFFTEL
jgi:hypothetical protein